MAESHAALLDVVVVPDFSGEQAMVFEERTLLFLASWLEYANRTRSFPLHVACIGPPPPSVQWLAGQCGASITIHEPLRAPSPYANKLRGLEIQGQAARVLLLDADIVALAHPGELAKLPPGIAAGPPDTPRVPDRCWERIYPALDLASPGERMRSVVQAYSLRASATEAGRSRSACPGDILPYYNSGVLLIPRDCGLREIWEEHIRRIASLADPRDEAWVSVARNDQTALATAVQCLRRRGVPFTRLPDTYNVRVVHLYTRTVTLADTTLFHATLSFKGPAASASYRQKLRHYRLSLFRRVLGLWRDDRGRRFRPTCLPCQVLPSLMEVHALIGQLQKLYWKHIVPALRHRLPVADP